MSDGPPAPDRLRLTPTVRAALFEHAREGAAEDPVEVCGVLGGKIVAAENERTARLTTLRRVPNVAEEPRYSYDLDPGETVEAIETLTDDGLTHLGFYHSHPEGPRGPSHTDEARATWPGYVYLIVSLGSDPTIGAWRWTGESFQQLPIEVAD